MNNTIILDYTVIADESILTLIQRVKKHCSIGWEPQGGIFESQVTGNYFQAMVLKISNDETTNS